MTRRARVNVAQSVHQKLLTRAKGEGRPFNELLQHYAIERVPRQQDFTVVHFNALIAPLPTF